MNCIDSTKHALFSKTLDKIALSTNDGKRHDMTRFPLLLMDIGFCEGECEISGSKCDQSEIKMQWKIVSNWLRAVLELSSSY